MTVTEWKRSIELLEFGQTVCGSTAIDCVIAWYLQTFNSIMVPSQGLLFQWTCHISFL